jgi:O-antigen/teichoic acid export membrane protein
MPSAFDDSEYAASVAPLKTDTLVDSVLILLALNVVQRLVGFVRALLFCRWLDAEQLGLWDMAFSFLVVAAPLAVLAIPGVFGRYVEHYRQRGQLRMFLRRTIAVCAAAATIACVVVLLTRRWLAVVVFGSADQAEMIALAAGSLVAVIAYNLLVELFTALRNVRFASVMQLVNSVAFAVLGIGLLLGWRCSAASALVAYGGSCLIAAVLAGFVLRRVWRSTPPAQEGSPHGALWGRMAPFAGWVLLGSILINLFGVIDRYMILHFSRMSASAALDAVGNYYAARVVPLLLISVATMLATIITPHLSHDWEMGRRDLVVARLRLFTKMFGFALFATATAVLLFSPLLFSMGFHGKYPQGEAVLPWILICCTWFGLSLILQTYLLCAERAGLLSVSLAIGLALNIPLNLLLLPWLGLLGAALSATASNALLLWSVCRFNHRFGFRFDTGVIVVLLLPVLLCCGVWPAILAVVVVAADAVWGNRLLATEEKRLLARGLVDYGKRFRPKRLFATPEKT